MKEIIRENKKYFEIVENGEKIEISQGLYFSIKNRRERDEDLKKLYSLLGLKNEDIENYFKKENFYNMYADIVEIVLDEPELIHVIIKGFDSVVKVLNYKHINFFYSTFLSDMLVKKTLNQTNNRTEKKYQEKIVENFNKIFPEYEFVEEYKKIQGLGIIDIIAIDKKTKRDVIIELKISTQNPNKQLIAYGSAYKNPILVAVTTKEVNNKIPDIIYKIIKYSELKI